MSVNPAVQPAVEITPLRTSDLRDLVRLHQAALPYSINSHLGSDHLSRLYTVTAEEATGYVAVARGADGPLGVVSASLDPERLSGILKSGLDAKWWLGLGMTCLQHPTLIYEALETSQLLRPVIFNGIAVKPCLHTIAVTSGAGRLGIGGALLEAVNRFMRSRSVPVYRLDTRLDNQAGRAFYRKYGFTEVEQRGRNIVLIKDLTPQA